MNLKDKNCIPHQSYVPPLSSDEKKSMIHLLGSHWELNHDESRIVRKYQFKNFKRALEFTNQVGLIAENQKHHPEIKLGWGYCHTEIWTHTNNNLVENDFILAAKIEDSFISYSQNRPT